MGLKRSVPQKILRPLDAAVSVLVRVGLRLVGALPPRLVLPLTRTAGTLGWIFARHRRQIIRRNLDIAFHETMSREEKSRLARRSFQYAVRCVASLGCQERWTDRSRLERFTISPEDAATLEAGPPSGNAVLTAHVGHWEMGQLYLHLRDFSVVAFARSIANRHIDAALRASRARRGGDIPNTAAGALRQLLREGKNVGILADQNDRRRMHYARFFGVPAASYIGYARILLRAGCRVLFMACLEEDPAAWRFRFLVRELRPARPHYRWGRDELRIAAKELVRDYLQCTEDVIRAYPEQYFWLHRRWKSLPANTPSLYHNLGTPLDPAVLEAARASYRDPDLDEAGSARRESIATTGPLRERP